MPTLRLQTSSVRLNTSWSDPNSALGDANDGTYALNSEYLTVGSTRKMWLYVSGATGIPAGATIDSMAFSVRAYVNGSAGFRSFTRATLWLTSSPPPLGSFTTGGGGLDGTPTVFTVTASRADLLAAGFTDENVRDAGLSSEFEFTSTSSNTVQMYWGASWVDVTYTLPPPSNALFFGENF